MQSFSGVLEYWSIGVLERLSKPKRIPHPILHHSITPLLQCYRTFYYTEICGKENRNLRRHREIQLAASNWQQAVFMGHRFTQIFI
jgi:hypothetical protein